MMTAEAKRVLVVDDDPAMLRLLGKWLELAGYEVERAGDGQQAIAAIERSCPSILITDWEMPNLDGMKLCQWLRAQKLPHYTYVVFLTARTSLDDMILGLQAGADDFLKKPVDRGELLARLHAGARFIEIEQRLSDLAGTDPLTSLATQRALFDYLHWEWKRVDRTTQPLACIMVDIDFFKRVNDLYGHTAGDDVIRRVGDLLKSESRGGDLVSRYGGEEFCIVLPETDLVTGCQWAERLRTRIAGLQFAPVDRALQLTASFGVAQRMADMTGPRDLVEMADQALLIAKRSGRDRVVPAGPIAGTAFPPAVDWIDQRMASLRARDVMTTIVAGLHQEETVANAARFFLRFRIGSAPVVDDRGCLVGIVSERDLTVPSLWKSWNETRVGEVMKQNVIAYNEETSVEQIFEFLGRASIRSVVIVHEGRPTGMISRTSLLRWFTNVVAVCQTNDKDWNGSMSSSRRNRIALTANRLAWEAGQLSEHVCCSQTDVVPCVVGSASRMQEMMTDLLSCSTQDDARLLYGETSEV